MVYQHYRYARRVDGDTVQLLNENLVECLRYKKTAADVTTLYGQTATTADLIIMPNSTDSYPKLTFNGNDTVYLALKSGKEFGIRNEAADLFYLYSSGSDSLVEAVANNNVYLKTSGSGYVKFGTYAASGDVACNGSITIKDSGGTARKLMTTA